MFETGPKYPPVDIFEVDILDWYNVLSECKISFLFYLYVIFTEHTVYLVAAHKDNMSYIWSASGQEAYFNTSQVANSSHGNCLMIGRDGYYGADCEQEHAFICYKGNKTK